MAQDAYDLLSRRPWNTPNNPDQGYSNLATWIFKEDGSRPHTPYVITVPAVADTRDSLSIAQGKKYLPLPFTDVDGSRLIWRYENPCEQKSSRFYLSARECSTTFEKVGALV
jgi:hypothetical protein